MSTNTTSFNKLLYDAHKALMRDLQDLLSETGEMPHAVLHSRLLRTKHDLAKHFRLEEEGGYLESLRSQQPHLNTAIDMLVDEHHKLLTSLDEILANLNQPEPQLADVREQCHRWVHEVRSHEIRENDLIQDAFLHDCGSGD